MTDSERHDQRRIAELEARIEKLDEINRDLTAEMAALEASIEGMIERHADFQERISAMFGRITAHYRNEPLH